MNSDTQQTLKAFEKAEWEENKGRIGSRFIKIHESTLSGRRHRKGYIGKRGLFSTRTLQSLCNWKERIEDGQRWLKRMRGGLAKGMR